MTLAAVKDAPLRAASRPTERSLRELFDQHAAFVARLLRNFGVADAEVEDALQQVFLVVSNKLGAIEAGAESSFLYRTSMWVASRARRSRGRRREVPGVDLSDEVDLAPGPEERAHREDARAALDRALDTMPDDIRAVFVLFEIEELTMKEIARTLGVPQGTVASRLRRGRELFEAAVDREAGEDV